MRLPPTLRTLLVPFALTIVVGGALLVVVLALSGVLPLPAISLPGRSDPSLEQAAALPTPSPQPINAAPPRPSPTPLPLPDDLTLVCEDNTHSFVLAHPDGKLVLAATRLLIPPGDDQAYIIADGRLARVSLDALDQDTGLLVMTQTEPNGLIAGNVPLQELADLGYDDTNNALLVLSKSGRVFRYDSGGQWSLVWTPQQAPDDQADPAYLSIDATDGAAYLLDADLNQVWRFDAAPQAEEERRIARIFPGPRTGGTNEVDMLVSGDVVLTADTHGALHRYNAGDRRPTLEVATAANLPLSLQAHDGWVYLVDGLERTVMAVDGDENTPDTGFRFSFPGMGLLRDVAMDEAGRLLALADNRLVVYDPARPSPAPCRALAPDDQPPLHYYGVDLAEALAGFEYPIDGGMLPAVPRAYPGARRLYRAGVHEGLDIHPWDVPGGIDVGEPVRAMQDGVVTRADVDYQPITKAEYLFLTEQALGLGASLPGTLDRIGGRQVFIDHGDRISTHYLHLDSIAEDVVPGADVKRGQVIGTVGISGTGGEAGEVFVVAHAHVEIWIGEHYLGQGVSLRETMWLWQQIFPDVPVAPVP